MQLFLLRISSQNIFLFFMSLLARGSVFILPSGGGPLSQVAPAPRRTCNISHIPHSMKTVCSRVEKVAKKKSKNCLKSKIAAYSSLFFTACIHPYKKFSYSLHVSDKYQLVLLVNGFFQSLQCFPTCKKKIPLKHIAQSDMKHFL